MNRPLPQTLLFDLNRGNNTGVFPSTRYQGSKYKLTGWIRRHVEGLEFDSAFDAFGGTGCVAHIFKLMGKKVFYNDHMKFNYYIGLALIENRSEKLDDADVENILRKDRRIKYPTFIQDTFREIYFTDEENEWLDVVVTNIERSLDIYKKALAYYALFQSCIIKRPFNLFHRRNLYIRLADVERSFGNKKTWDTPFEIHFRNFAEQANRAVFDNGRENKAFCSDVFKLKLPEHADLISRKGVGVDYFDFYHFLEGLTDYWNWFEKINRESKHKRLISAGNPWTDKSEIRAAFERLFEKYKRSILVVSYRDDGVPSVDELADMLKKYKKNVDIKTADYKYVLSNGNTKEVLLIAQ